jgi:hypothetical protein
MKRRAHHVENGGGFNAIGAIAEIFAMDKTLS